MPGPGRSPRRFRPRGQRLRRGIIFLSTNRQNHRPRSGGLRIVAPPGSFRHRAKAEHDLFGGVLRNAGEEHHTTTTGTALPRHACAVRVRILRILGDLILIGAEPALGTSRRPAPMRHTRSDPADGSSSATRRAGPSSISCGRVFWLQRTPRSKTPLQLCWLQIACSESRVG